MSAAYDPRADSMHKSYDSRSYFRVRKVQAVERLLRLLYRRLAPDFRLVHRFRQWQMNDLNKVLQEIYFQSREKNKSYRKDIFTLLSGKVKGSLKSALRLWKLFVKQQRKEMLTAEVVTGAAKLAGAVLATSFKTWANRDFPMFYQTPDNANRLFLLTHSFAHWKSTSITHLLNDNHREMAAVRLCQVLYMRIKPLQEHAFAQLRLKRRWRAAFACLVPLVERLRWKWQHHAWSLIAGLRFAQKTSITDQISAATALLECTLNRRQRVKYAFVGVRRFGKSVEGEYATKLRRMCKCLSLNQKQLRLKTMMRWKECAKPTVRMRLFDIDSSVIRNQMQIALLLEQQIITRRLQSSNLQRKTKLLAAISIAYRRLRIVFTQWRRLRGAEVREEDVLYEYVRFLEEQNGVINSLVPSRKK